MNKKGILLNKSFDFAARIVNLSNYISKVKREHIIANQVKRSGTAVCSLLHEAQYAESKQDFIHKFAIAQKECNETLYWLKLLYQTQILNQQEYDSIVKDAIEIMNLISSSIITAKKSQLSLKI